MVGRFQLTSGLISQNMYHCSIIKVRGWTGLGTNLILPLCILDKSLSLSELPFSHLENGDDVIYDKGFV